MGMVTMKNKVKQQKKAKRIDPQVAKLQKQLELYKGQLAKALADYDNLKKRTQVDVELIIFNRIKDLSENLISICDNLNFALKEKNRVSQDWVDGIVNIISLIPNLLSELGVKEIPVKIGDYFEPGTHEAIGRRANKHYKKNQIVEIVQKGYKIEDRVLRPVRVLISP